MADTESKYHRAGRRRNAEIARRKDRAELQSLIARAANLTRKAVDEEPGSAAGPDFRE